jgi:hypothetical protein
MTPASVLHVLVQPTYYAGSGYELMFEKRPSGKWSYKTVVVVSNSGGLTDPNWVSRPPSYTSGELSRAQAEKVLKRLEAAGLWTLSSSNESYPDVDILYFTVQDGNRRHSFHYSDPMSPALERFNASWESTEGGKLLRRLSASG